LVPTDFLVEPDADFEVFVVVAAEAAAAVVGVAAEDSSEVQRRLR